MFDDADLQALADSLGEPEVFRTRRRTAFTALDQESVAMPVSLPIERGEGCALAISGADQPGVHVCLHAELDTLPDWAQRQCREQYASLLLTDQATPEIYRHFAWQTLGVIVAVEPGAVLPQPIVLSYTNTHDWAATHVTILVGEGAQLTCVQDLQHDRGGEDRAANAKQGGLWSHGTEVFAAEQAVVDVVTAQLQDAPSESYIQQRSRLQAGATVHWRNVTLGAAVAEQAVIADITGAHAESSVDWLFYARDKERQQLSARNVFGARDGRGEMTLRGVAEQQARVACDGLIDISLQGGGTDTYLTEEVLMLDPTCVVDAVPGLEIKTNDVKASHSATVARVTEEDLFYFAARGIPAKIAREMYVLGFLGDLCSRIADEIVRDSVLEAISAKYHR